MNSSIELIAQTFSGYGLYVVGAFALSHLLLLALLWQHWQAHRQIERDLKRNFRETL